MVADSDPHELAQAGLSQIEEAILRLLDANPQGLRNVDIARALGLSFEFSGKYKNHITHGTLGSLESRGLVSRDEDSKLFFSRNGDAPGIEAAQTGLANIESAILNLLSDNPAGLKNVEIANRLGLTSEFRGSYRNYLTYTVLMRLQNQRKVRQDSGTKLFALLDNGVV
ncbi:MAG: hypothetical protein OXI91_06030 [Chloroflexota bacterium]|nr:hypothetical protein [Chloroflexota bacterium]